MQLTVAYLSYFSGNIKRACLGGLGLCGKVILKRTVKICGMRVGVAMRRLNLGSVAAFCEHGHESWIS
jgi:hypothetical protein